VFSRRQLESLGRFTGGFYPADIRLGGALAIQRGAEPREERPGTRCVRCTASERVSSRFGLERPPQNDRGPGAETRLTTPKIGPMKGLKRWIGDL